MSQIKSNTRVITYDEAIALCNREESHTFDFKSYQSNGEVIQKAVVAFANADGGELIIGIEDKNKRENNSDNLSRLKGSNNIEYYNYVFQILNTISGLDYDAEFLEYLDNIILSLTIERSREVCQTDKKEFFVRKSAQSLRIRDFNKIKELEYSKGASSYEDVQIKDAAINDVINSDELKKFLLMQDTTMDGETYIRKQNLVDKDTNIPRAAGVLLFTDEPSPIFPRRCAIKIVRYDTSEDEPKREHLKETFTVEGCLNQQIRHAINKVLEIVNSLQIWEQRELVNVKYPPETIWEILTNAVIHRDYSIADDIHVQIFNNRIVIKSPGRLPTGVTVENILESRISRNPKIVRNLNRYNDPVNKDMGEGLNTAFQKMSEFRLKNPIIMEDNNSVIVTIPHTKLASPEQQVLEYLQDNDIITNKIGRKLTGIDSENKMKNVFSKLRDKGILELDKTENGGYRGWRKVNKPE